VKFRENLPARNELKRAAVANIEKDIVSEFPGYADFSTVDSVRLALKEGWY